MAKNQYKRRKPTMEDLLSMKSTALTMNKIHPSDSENEDIQADAWYGLNALVLSCLPDLVDEVIKYRQRGLKK